MCLVCAISPSADLTSTKVGVTLRLLPRKVLAGVISLYRRYVSPFSPPSCRFTPTCSRYAVDALMRYGAVQGSWLALWRILRCNPIHRGGYDPLR
jgi:putative membrane protein insertion efficiency factor